MIAISGARGVGKTTLMLQRQKEIGGIGVTSLYVTMEHPYFYNHTLYEFMAELYKMGFRFLFVDEVHKYATWSKELKIIYDLFPDFKVVFSASSALDIYRGEADLSRRVFTYKLPGLSFREYLKMRGLADILKISVDQLLKEHIPLSQDIVNLDGFHILPEFNRYLKNSYYPFMVHLEEKDYTIRLSQVISTVMDTDMAYAEDYSPATAHKLKKLLAVLAMSIPFQPNIAELARKLTISRDAIYQYLNHLERASLILALRTEGKRVSLLQKPEKLFLENTNLAYGLSRHPDKGNLKETFMMNQLVHSGLKVTAPKQGDFYFDGITLEVGGRQKNNRQIAEIKNAFIAADDILNGFGNKIPIWLFGMLY
ncbi:MAG TPA: AAA family ATPase [Arachidicoccus sp.]|nr:AAA family ATPase [Arachidicoccus sp.]